MAVGDKGEGGLGLVDLELGETYRLIETVDASGLEAGLLKLLDGVGLRFAETFATRVAAFERIVGKELHMRPPGVAVEV